MLCKFAIIVAAALAAGCAVQPGLKPLAADDPANPQAPEATVGSAVPLLSLESAPVETGNEASAAPSAGSPMRQMEMKGVGAMPRPEPAASRPADSAADQSKAGGK